ncbi:uracil phosphoribosyltransferase [Falsibacillus albus]|uniref:Uracil phosphoribosyltransferase n=1 Tax=Falsibacillus albus TaxID=2478915 RepID=A0A3L7K0R3_9BACI|nr:uracil phosphoribosyltransferase [Falsibacillus albus]RLQ95541.1 uracil phosphoribosyltransferase [Falsibacillus albus]
MAKSNARKKRDKLIREGKQNPEMHRGLYALADLRTRKTKTKTEKQFQMKHKGRLSQDFHEDHRLFLFC